MQDAGVCFVEVVNSNLFKEHWTALLNEALTGNVTFDVLTHALPRLSRDDRTLPVGEMYGLRSDNMAP